MNDTTAIVSRPEAPALTPYEVIERVISSGDIGRMDPEARIAFYWRTCESLGLNPLTQPFSYLNLDGKIVLYARKDATEQLRRVNRVSVTELRRERDEELGTYTVYAHGQMPDGRSDVASGVVAVKGLSGGALANALMKAETKAKRRLTLSLCGLGFLDESEVEGLGERVDVDVDTGEIRERPKPASLLEAVQRQAETLSSTSTDPVEATVTISPTGVQDAIQPEPDAGAFMAEPMTPEASAETPYVEEDEEPDIPEEELLEALGQTRFGLSIQELADRARAAGVGKLKFAVALDAVPADVGKRIEAMTDQERYDLAVILGIAS